MVKLSDIDIGTKDVAIALLSGLAGYYARRPIDERRQEEELKHAELFGRAAAQYIAEELKTKGLPTTEIYRAIDDMTKTLTEVKDVLKEYKLGK